MRQPQRPLSPGRTLQRHQGRTSYLESLNAAPRGIICSDRHQVRGHLPLGHPHRAWGLVRRQLPVVVGHEIAGVVEAVGTKVTRHAVGDRVGVGGYSTSIVVDENYVLRIPDGLPLEAAAPLLCAGITMYAPLRNWGAGPGKRVAIVGMEGLGHMGIKIAAALGAEVTVLSRSLKKQEDALRLGAQQFRTTSDPATFDDLRGRFRPSHQHCRRRYRRGRVPFPACPGWHDGSGGIARQTFEPTGLVPRFLPSQPQRFQNGRDQADAGNAGLLCRSRTGSRGRNHSGHSDHCGLRPGRCRRCSLSLRH